ncbi:SMI1/KNR4 family protein [Sorangium cellulosum]|uniref:SMI1/KNR4 family protein n=1 Tax=Sorangium cellulosum TaxID=56 RepID=UPI0009B8CDFC
MSFEQLAQRIRSNADREVGTGATEEDIAAAEQALGIPLRGGYRDFLRSFGWGGVSHFELYGLGADVPQYLHLVSITQSERRTMTPRLPPHLIPIMNDGGGNLFCLNTTINEPTIVLWDHEHGEDQQPEWEASTFVEWLDRLLDAVRP